MVMWQNGASLFGFQNKPRFAGPAKGKASIKVPIAFACSVPSQQTSSQPGTDGLVFRTQPTSGQKNGPQSEVSARLSYALLLASRVLDGAEEPSRVNKHRSPQGRPKSKLDLMSYEPLKRD